jgi:hypothetical protein
MNTNKKDIDTIDTWLFTDSSNTLLLKEVKDKKLLKGFLINLLRKLMENDNVLELKTGNDFEVITTEKIVNVSKELELDLRTDTSEELKEIVEYYSDIHQKQKKKNSFIDEILLSTLAILLRVKSKMKKSGEKEIDPKIIFDLLNDEYDFSTMEKGVISDLIEEFNQKEMYELSHYLNEYLNK